MVLVISLLLRSVTIPPTGHTDPKGEPMTMGRLHRCSYPPDAEGPMTTTATRPARMPEEILKEVSLSHMALVDALESMDSEEITEAMADLIEDLSQLQAEWRDDWQYCTGNRTPQGVADAHLAYLQA